MVFFSSWWYNWWYGVNKLGAVNAYATALPAMGPYNSVQLGMLKQLDQMVNDLEKASGTQVHLVMLLRERAMAALPENTASLLRGNMMSSEVALELVRRDITEYSQLSSGLYGSTAEDLEKDPALKKIHDRLSMAVELHGVLTLAGITPGEREWAQTLADTFVDLRSLRATPWSEIAWLLGLIELSPEKPENDEGNTDPDAPVTEGLKNTFDNPPTGTELRIIQELYSIGEGAPPIRAQVLGFRMSLDVADELESLGIYDASQMTESDQRRLLFKAQQKDADGSDEDEAEDGKKGGGGPKTGGGKIGVERPSGPQPLTAEPEARSRAIPALVAVATKVLPVAVKVLPKLIQGSKLTSAASGGSSAMIALGKNLSAMKANATNAGSSATTGANSGGSKAGSAVSGLVPSRLAAAGGKLDEFSSTVNSATGAVQSLKGLYSELSPDVEAQVAAIEQEKARLNRSLDLVRAELEKVDVSAELAENLKATQTALDKAKGEVAADPNFGARIAQGSSLALQQSLTDQRLAFDSTPLGLGSYASNEELVAKASGGLAMYGMNFFPTTEDIVIKPYAPILQNPSFIEMTGAVSPFEAKVEKTTSQTKAAAFHNTSSNAGITVAETVSTTKGTSASGSAGIFASVSASGSTSKATNDTKNESEATESSSKSSQASSTSSATIIEYIRCPMKSFRIPVSQMSLSSDAFAAVIEVDNIEKGEDFLDNFGSHVSTGRQELGGIFFNTVTLTSEKSQSTVSMMSAASETSEKVKKTSRQSEVGGGVSTLFGSAKASTSFGKTTSMGVAEVKGSASAEEKGEATESAQYESYVRCVGPNTPTPEAFAEALFTDTSTWAVTDRGRLEAMVPVTVLLQQAANQVVTVDGSELGVKNKLENAILFVKAAWRRRAKYWGYLLKDRPDLDVPTPVLNLIKSAFPSSLGRVPTLLEALVDSLIIRHTNLEDIKSRPGLINDEAKKIAKNIAEACREAEKFSNNFLVELPFLDAKEVQKQVTKEIENLQEANKQSFAAVGLTNKDGTFEVEEGVAAEIKRVQEADQQSSVASGPTDEQGVAAVHPAVAAVDPTVATDSTVAIVDPTDKWLGSLWDNAPKVEGEATNTSWEDLEEWQRKWIQQTIEQGGSWNQELYQLFQRRYFSEDQSSNFIEKLTERLADAKVSYTRVVAVMLSEKEAKKEALQRAVSRMLKADWLVMADLWLDDKNSIPEYGDEYGPEGDALWTRLQNGVGLFEETENARFARNKLLDEYVEAPDTPKAIQAYEKELVKWQEVSAPAKALNELLTYKWSNVGGNGTKPVSDSFQASDFAKPLPDVPDEEDSSNDDDDQKRETIDQAINRLREKYDLLDAAFGSGLIEQNEANRRLILANLVVLERDSANNYRDERMDQLKIWRKADTRLDAATLAYNTDFPEE